MADPQETAKPNTSLTAFEHLVFGGDYGAAMAMLLRMLDAIEHGAEIPQDSSDEAGARAYFTRFAAAIATLLARDPAPMAPSTVDRLAFHNRHIAAVFRLSGYADPGQLYKLVFGVRNRHTDEATAARILSAASIASPDDINWPELLRVTGSAASSAFLAQFSHRAPLSDGAERRRLAMLNVASLLEGHELRDSQLPLLCQAWMFCSYLTSPNRHELKKILNGLIANWLERSGVTSLPSSQAGSRTDSPVLVVVADVMMSWHAMFKTYANFLKQLRARFRLVLVCLEGRTDEAARAVFDEIQEIPDSPNALRDAVAKIRQIGPAVLYYPSVGMSVLTVQLCNLRLAAMQVASVGHPATTYSPMIDYMVMGHTYYSDAARFSERVLLLQSTGALFEPTMGATPPEPELRDAPDTLRIAVSSSTLKLNASFLACCRDIESSSAQSVEFHFFPNERGIRHRDCAFQVKRVLPDAVVHERTGYDAYLDLLNRCDIRLGTFPFGGANTTMDAYLLGIPTITLAGAEPHSRTDARFVALFDMPDWLVADDEDSYREAACRLVDDNAERIALSRRILDAVPERTLFEKEQSEYPTDFADALWWAYTYHAAIQGSDRRVWCHEDRVAFAGDKE